MARTRSVGQLVGWVREDVVEPGKEAVRVAIRTNGIAERMRGRRIETVTRGDGATKDADGCAAGQLNAAGVAAGADALIGSPAIALLMTFLILSELPTCALVLRMASEP
jgi:hypothetical protein